MEKIKIVKSKTGYIQLDLLGNHIPQYGDVFTILNETVCSTTPTNRETTIQKESEE